MKKTSNFLKRRWFLLFLTIIAIVLFLIKILIRPEPLLPTTIPPKPTATDPSQVFKPASSFGIMIGGEFLTINLNKNNFKQLPNTLPTFPILTNSLVSQVNLLNKNFGRVVYNSAINQITFSGKYSFAPARTPYREAEALLKEKLTSLSLIDSDSTSKIEGLAPYGQELLPIADLASAQVWRITFQQKVNQYPLISLSLQSNTIVAEINNSGQLTDLLAYLFQPDQNNSVNSSLKNFETVITELKEGQGELTKTISTNNESFSPPPMDLIKNISLENVSVVYLLGIKNQKTYQPYFLFGGTLTYQTGESIKAEMILSATK